MSKLCGLAALLAFLFVVGCAPPTNAPNDLAPASPNGSQLPELDSDPAAYPVQNAPDTSDVEAAPALSDAPKPTPLPDTNANEAIYPGPTPPSTPDSTIRIMVEKAKEDLAQHLSVDKEAIKLVESLAVEWPDTGLGCPQPDMAYAAVITIGYWILLEADGEIYPYHADEGEQVILCLGNPSDPDSPLRLIPVDPGEIKDGEPWMPVD